MTARRFAHLNYHAPLGRLGGAVGAKLQAGGWDVVQQRCSAYADNRGLWTFLTTDDNDHGKTKPHPRAKLLNHQGPDKVWAVPPRPLNGSALELLDTAIVDLTIDGHNSPAARVKLTWGPGAGRPLVLWIAQANLGRDDTAEEFTANAMRLKRRFRGRALIGWDEIDEADAPDEHTLLRDVYPASEGFDQAGWGSLVPITVPPQLTLEHVNLFDATPGMRKVTPPRVITEAILSA